MPHSYELIAREFYEAFEDVVGQWHPVVAWNDLPEMAKVQMRNAVARLIDRDVVREGSVYA